MTKLTEQIQIQDQLQGLSASMSQKELLQMQKMLNGLPAADIAHLLESSPHTAREILWRLVDKKYDGEVLHYLNEDIQKHFLHDLSAEEVSHITEGLETDDLADVLQQLPQQVIQEVLNNMDSQDRQRVETVLSYPDDCAGGLMNTDTITVRPRFTLDVVLRYLRRHTEIPEMTDNIVVVNRHDDYVGLLPLNKLLVSDPQVTVREIMLADVEAIPVTMPEAEVARLFERHNWVSAAVVNENGRLLGRITIDDIVDVIRDDADHSLMSMAGLDEEDDTFAPVMKTSRRRALWLGVNLMTAFLASFVISQFSATIDKVVALAVLMPIVASMGGVAGTQTLTLVIRSMALGQIVKSNALWLIRREIGVAAVNGILWAVVVAVVAIFWFDDRVLGYIIAGAMMVNLLTAAIAGAYLPIFLKAINIDPALAGSVALTTITDVIGFCSFLGLASLFYL